MSPDELKALREKARLAMMGEARLAKVTEENKLSEEKRRAAFLAMESREHKQKREEVEKENKEREDMRRQVDDEVRRQSDTVARQKEAEEKAKREAEENRQKEIIAKERAFMDSRGVIENLKKESGTGLHPLRTLKSDMNDAIKGESMSATSMAIAEQGKKSAPVLNTAIPTPARSGSGTGILIFIIIILLLLGGGAAGYWYWQQRKNLAPEIPVKLVVQSVIYADKSYEIDSDKTASAALVAAISNLTSGPTSTREMITNIYFTKKVPTTDGSPAQSTILAFDEFLRYGGIPVPVDFSRFIKSYMVGLYQGAAPALFVVLKTDLYPNVYQWFLDHEGDLVRIMFKNITGEDLAADTAGQNFTDYRLKNIDTRVLKNSTGQTVLIYSFFDTQTLVIAQNEDALYRAYLSYNSPR